MSSIYIVDSFTNKAFCGNPAAVHVVAELEDNGRMQRIAQEMNLSETAFVAFDGVNDVHPIRFFSPKMEIPLCGHATLAAAKVLFEISSDTSLTFENGDGIKLQVSQIANQIEMQFPLYELEDAIAPRPLLSALGVQEVAYCGLNRETKILMLELGSTEELCRLEPDFRALVSAHNAINGVVVTARSKGEFDFYSRYFWPWSGGDEDPVTGGTHTFLAKHWSDRLRKSKLRSFQASRRGGQMVVEISKDSLLIRGEAVIVLRGSLFA
ncbi:MAG: PhzF family phenazine biosynthesis protein [Planctomycetota bacterium]